MNPRVVRVTPLVGNIVLALAVLLLTTVAAFGNGGVDTITISKPTEPVMWPRFGVYCSANSGTPLADVLAGILDKQAAWGIGAVRIMVRAGSIFDGLDEQFARPEARDLYIWLTLPAEELELDPAAIADQVFAFCRAAGRAPDAIEYINEPHQRQFASFLGETYADRADAFRTFCKLVYAELATRNVHVPMIVSTYGDYIADVAPLGALVSVADLHVYASPVSDDAHTQRRPSCILAARKVGELETRPRAISTNVLSGADWYIAGYNKDAGAELKVLVGDTLIGSLHGDPDFGWRGLRVTDLQAEGPCEIVCGAEVWQNAYVSRMPVETSADYARWLDGAVWIDATIRADAARLSDAISAWSVLAEAPAYGQPDAVQFIFGEGATFYSGHRRCQYGLAAGMIFAAGYGHRAEYVPLAVHWQGHPHLAGDTPLSWTLEHMAVVCAGDPRVVSLDAVGLYAIASQEPRTGRLSVLIVNTLEERSVRLERAPGVPVWRFPAPHVWYVFARADVPINGDPSAADVLTDCDRALMALLPAHADGSTEIICPTGITHVEF